MVVVVAIRKPIRGQRRRCGWMWKVNDVDTTIRLWCGRRHREECRIWWLYRTQQYSQVRTVRNRNQCAVGTRIGRHFYHGVYGFTHTMKNLSNFEYILDDFLAISTFTHHWSIIPISRTEQYCLTYLQSTFPTRRHAGLVIANGPRRVQGQ